MSDDCQGSGILNGLFCNPAKARTISTNSVLFQLGLMTGISVITLLVFEVLRPNHKRIYQPKVKYYVGNKRPPAISGGMMAWLPPLIHTKEPQLLEQLGLDAVAFLRFLRMLRWMFLCIAIVACGILIPVNEIWSHKNVDPKLQTPLGDMTIQYLTGNILFLHVGVSYVINFIVMGFVYVNWKAMVRLRNEWFHSPEYAQSFYARTLMVTDVPKKLQSDEGLSSLFHSLQIPYPTTAVHIGRRVGQLPELIEYHNDTVRKLETVLVRYLKNGRVGKKRPVLTQGGFLGFGGTKVDAIDFYTEKLRRVEESIERWRETIDTRKAEPYGFASMAAVPYAHIVAAYTRRKRKHGAVISLAPNPKDIIWQNLNAPSGARIRKRILGWTYLVLFCAFNTVPLLAISVLANLSSLTAYVSFLDNWSQKSPNTFALVSGVLPPAVMGIFAVIFPIVLRQIGKYQGAETISQLDRVTVQRYFAFLIISQLVIFTLIGVVFNTVKLVITEVGKHMSFQEIFDNLHTVPQDINSTYLEQSNYWLTWFPLRGFLIVFDLAQILNLVWVTIKTHLFGRTPRDIREWTQPPDFEYSIYYSNFLFMAAVAFVFAPQAPLLVAVATLMFWISATVYKYQLMFVFTTKVESGGRMWNTVINRLLVSVVFMQLLMTLTIGLQLGFKSWMWVSTIPPIIFIIIFKMYISRTFSKPFKYYTPSQAELQAVRPHSEKADHKGRRLEKRFGHPALNQELFTPMVHSQMTHLLAEVYRGRLGTEETDLKEYGGQKVEAKVAPGGLRIAGIDSNDLEYDPALYQRDRGELDWDARSMTSTAYLGDTGSIYNGNPGQPVGYEDYLNNGPRPMATQSTDAFEMSRIPTREDNTPLLHNMQGMRRQDTRDTEWATPNVSPGGTQYPPQQHQQAQYNQYPPQYPPQYPSQAYDYGPGQGPREANVQRFQGQGQVQSGRNSPNPQGGFTGVGAGYRR